MPALPSGTVTFLFTDIEGSTVRWEQHPAQMRAALARHDALLHEGITAHGGVVVTERGEGDSFFAFFARPTDALVAACALQRALAAEMWPDEVAPIRVRMALHTGEAAMWEGRDYRGAPVNRCARLRAVAYGGQILLSGATYELVRDLLPDGVHLRDLGVHRLKDLTRPEHIFQVVLPDLPADFPPLRTLDWQPHNLPVQPTALIGREREVEAVRQLLMEPDARLLTLTGPGGTGKTRLALQVGAEVLDAFPDGVFFVNLAPITEAALVLPTVAQTLGVTDAGSQPLKETLHAFLRDKRLLLLLDNFEQVLDAAPVVSDLLAACGGVRVLVTSRAALHLRGERLYAVPPLSLPDTPSLVPLHTLTQYEAVRLFIARARDVKPDFAVTNETAPAVAEICVRLDGLPLAIELAAARIRMFTPQELLSRLAHRLSVLTGGARDLPERQRTLRGAIDWSYSLLTPEEQRLFARLSVFLGGRTLEAIEVVCNADGALDVLSGVESLLEKSLLLQTEDDGQTRFVMLETLHEYARERLKAGGEADHIARMHAEYFLALAEEAAPQLKGVEQGRWLERLEQEHDNLRAALRWLRERGEVAQSMRLAGALGYFWALQGHWSEGRGWLEDLFALPVAGGDATQVVAGESRLGVTALNAAARLAIWQHDYVRARSLAEASVALAQDGHDVPGFADAYVILGDEALYHRWALDEAKHLYSQSADLARSVADSWRTAAALFGQAMTVYHAGDSVEAAAIWEESDALYRTCGDPTGRAAVLGGLGELLNDQGDIAQAVQYLQGAVALRANGPVRNRAQTMLILAEALTDRGAYDEAEALLAQALAIFRTVGASASIARCRTNLARLHLIRDGLERAEMLLGESLEQARAADAPFEVARALMVQGNLLTARELYDRADAAYRESLEVFESTHLPPAIAWVLRPFGVLAQRQGHLALARERLERGLTLLHGEWRPYYAPIPVALGRVATGEGNLDEAERLVHEGLSLERSMGRPREIAEALEGLAEVALAQGRPERGVRLAAAAAGIRASIGAPLPPYEQAAFAHSLDALRESLGAAAFDATWTGAAAVGWEEIVDEALAGR